MVKCAVKKCEAIGKHRFKQLQKIKIVDLPLRDCKDQRLCEEHYIHYYGDEIENEWNGTMYEDGMKYEDVEFLDSSLLFQSENDPVDDKLTHDELTDQDYTSRLMKLWRLIGLSGKIVLCNMCVLLVTNTTSEHNRILEKFKNFARRKL